MAVGLRLRSLEIFAISAYFQYSVDTRSLTDRLTAITNKLGLDRLIIGADVNAHSPLWYSERRNERGEVVEDFLAECRLTVVNEPVELTTYAASTGCTNIDVTLASPTLARRVAGWRVVDATSSDHRLITFSLLASGPVAGGAAARAPLGRYNLRIGDIEAYESNLAALIAGSDIDTRHVEDAAGRLGALIHRAAEGAIPRSRTRRGGARSVPWWSAEIATAKSQARRARKRYLRELDGERRQALSVECRNARNRLNHLIREAKAQSFRSFVRQSSDDNPFGLWYRVANNKYRAGTVLCSPLQNEEGGPSPTVEEASMALLEALVPSEPARVHAANRDFQGCMDHREDESVRNIAVGQVAATAEPPSILSQQPERLAGPVPFDTAEVGRSLLRMRTGKAPGPDMIPVELLRSAWRVRSSLFVSFFNACLYRGIFPACWKIAEVVPILKPGKDPGLVKSLRPVSLLPTLGKWLEGLMVARLEAFIESRGLRDDRQYGYVPGRGTEDAVNRLVRSVSRSPSKYVMGVFLDISGAFDCARWSDITGLIRDTGCCPYLADLYDSYFSGRRAQMTLNWGSVTRELDRGCPQGSRVGPLGWRLLFETFLRLAWPSGVEVTAYADDAALLIHADKYRDLETIAARCGDRMREWSSRYDMTFSVPKTVAVLLKGRLKDSPNVRLMGERVPVRDEVKYLGVTLARGLRFDPHIELVCEKAAMAYHHVARLARYDWGVSFSTARLVYRATVESIVTYVSSAFAHRATLVKPRARLRRAQRHALIGMTRAFRTTSTDALCVLAGVVPLDYLVRERAALYRLKRGEPPEYDRGNDLEPRKERESWASVKRRVRSRVLQDWGGEWRANPRGRALFSFLPDVEERMGKLEWLRPCKYATWLMTGHGPFGAYFALRRIEATVHCRCGANDFTVAHLMTHCDNQAVRALRLRYYSRLTTAVGKAPEGDTDWVNTDWLSNEGAYRLLCQYSAELIATIETPGGQKY